MKINYHLVDDGGISSVWDQEILLPIGAIFRHEFGVYEVKRYRDADGLPTEEYENIEQVECDRIRDNKQLRDGKSIF